MPPLLTRPCACGVTIVAPDPFSGGIDATAAILRDHYRSVAHELWSTRRRWALEIGPQSAAGDELAPTGREMRAHR